MLYLRVPGSLFSIDCGAKWFNLKSHVFILWTAILIILMDCLKLHLKSIFAAPAVITCVEALLALTIDSLFLNSFLEPEFLDLFAVEMLMLFDNAPLPEFFNFPFINALNAIESILHDGSLLLEFQWFLLLIVFWLHFTKFQGGPNIILVAQVAISWRNDSNYFLRERLLLLLQLRVTRNKMLAKGITYSSPLIGCLMSYFTMMLFNFSMPLS